MMLPVPFRSKKSKQATFQVVNRSMTIRQSFGLGDYDPPESSQSFMRLTIVVEAFFNRLIVVNGLDEEAVKKQSEELGRRHMTYSKKGYQPVFWDVFTVGLLELLK